MGNIYLYLFVKLSNSTIFIFQPLRNALNSMKVSTNLIPDHLTGSLSYSVSTYLKKLKHEAKARADRFMQLKKESENFTPAEIPR